jgi:hypothetical protein
MISDLLCTRRSKQEELRCIIYNPVVLFLQIFLLPYFVHFKNGDVMNLQ